MPKCQHFKIPLCCTRTVMEPPAGAGAGGPLKEMGEDAVSEAGVRSGIGAGIGAGLGISPFPLGLSALSLPLGRMPIRRPIAAALCGLW